MAMAEMQDARNLHLVDRVTASLTVYVQPGYANNVELGVRKELDGHLLRYMEDQEAVLLGYTNLDITTKQALLSNYFPYLTIIAKADLVLFKPNPGAMLVGRVHKLSSGLLGVLVLGGINAIIGLHDMPEGFKFDIDHNCWVQHDDYSRAIMMGDLVACKVLSCPVTDPDQDELLFNLDASLLAEGAGLCKQQPEQQQRKRTQLAAAVAAAGGGQGQQQTPANGLSKSAKKAEKQRLKEERKKEREARRKAKQERKQQKEQAKAAKRKERDEDATEQPAAKKQKHSSSSKKPPPPLPQLQQQQPMANGMPAAAKPQQPPAAVAAAPAAAAAAAGNASTPAAAAGSSKKQKKEQKSDKKDSRHKDKKHRDKDKERKQKKDKGK